MAVFKKKYEFVICCKFFIQSVSETKIENRLTFLEVTGKSLVSFLTNGVQRRRQGSVAPPGFCNMGEVRYGSIGGLEYEVPQSRLYCLCINVALCSTALRWICRVIRRSSMTMKAHTYYIIFGRPPIGGSFPPSPWRRHCQGFLR